MPRVDGGKGRVGVGVHAVTVVDLHERVGAGGNGVVTVQVINRDVGDASVFIAVSSSLFGDNNSIIIFARLLDNQEAIDRGGSGDS